MRDLPDFDDPPVIETVLGIEFVPLAGWAVPHFGLFWKRIQDRYPRFEVHPPLVSGVESPRLEFRQPQPPKVELVPGPQLRCWFINDMNTELIQVQHDRFVHNWRKVAGAGTYPHYEEYIRPAFERDWQEFFDFLGTEKIGFPGIGQAEVTYVNHIDRGKGWESFADLPKVFPCWAGKSCGDFLPSPESVQLNVSYAMPDERGRLRISLLHAFRSVDAKETLQLTLTAKVKPRTNGATDLLECLNLGREWVVRGFTDFTSKRMHKIWRRKI